MKINKDSAREKFRKTCNIKEVFSVEMQDPNYEYKWVNASTTHEGLKRIDRYIDNGWEVVYSKEKAIDQRSTSASQDGKEDDLRVSPVSTTTRSGATMILMRCSNEQRKENELRKYKERKERFRAQQKLIKSRGNEYTIESPEVNFKNLSEDK